MNGHLEKRFDPFVDNVFKSKPNRSEIMAKAKREFKCVTVDGKIEFKSNMTLEEMQAFVGGWIEIARGYNYVGLGNHDYIVNEEGLLRGLEPNLEYPMFVGNVIVCIGGMKD